MDEPKEIYSQLSAPMRLKKDDDEMQAVVERFNKVCGVTGWGYSYKPVKEYSGRLKNVGPYHAITIAVAIWVIDKDLARVAIGGSTAADYTKALEGAMRVAFLRAAAFWGVGQMDFGAEAKMTFEELVPMGGVELDSEETPEPEGFIEGFGTEEDKPVGDLRRASKAMAAEDGAPPARAARTLRERQPPPAPVLNQPQAPMPSDNQAPAPVPEGEQRYLLKLSKQVGREAQMKAWLQAQHTRAEIVMMGKTLENLLRPKADGMLPANAG